MRIEIAVSAADDIAEGYLFYETQDLGLGYYFEVCMMSHISSLQIYAGIHEVHFEKYHRMITNRFPYAIYYQVEGEIVRVYAVIDTRRSTQWINERLN